MLAGVGRKQRGDDKQPAKQTRWAVLAASGLSNYKVALSAFGRENYELGALPQKASRACILQELEREGLPSEEAARIVGHPAVKAIMDFSLGIPGILAIVADRLILHDGLRDLR